MSRIARRVPLLVRFGLLTGVAFLVLGIVVADVLGSRVTERAMANAEANATVIVEHSIEPTLSGLDLSVPLTGRAASAVDLLLHEDMVVGRIARIKVWAPDGTVSFSDDTGIVGDRVEPSANLRAAVAGETFTNLIDPAGGDHAGERGEGRLMEVWVPLVDGRGIFGAVELYLPFQPVAETIAADRRELILYLGLGLLALYAVSFQIVAAASRALRRYADQTSHQAHHDALTDLPNRLLFAERVDQAVRLANRHGHSVAVMLLDLDRFKEINDTLGHHIGDELLVMAGDRLRASLRGSDTVARLGGDEFAVLLPEVDGVAGARRAATKVLEAMDAVFPLRGMNLDVSVSIGVAIYPTHAADVESLLQRADIAMYDAKRVGRTFELYAADQDENSTDRLVLLGELREGIREGALVVHYQPKAEITTGRVHSVEALVRWQHPTRGLVPPDRFIPLAESAGMMAELTACVLDQSLAQLRRWLDDGHELRMAVNMSARNLHDLNFPSVVEEHLLRHGVEAGALELELTETSLLVEPARALVVLTELHRLGVRLAIDDFGTGYSSLAYLKRLPIHALKIDRSFVQDMTTNANDRVIVHSTIGLARNLGLEVVAEGVESNEAWAELQADGCDVAQGYLIARPMDSSAATDWIEQWAADGFDPPRLVGDAAEA